MTSLWQKFKASQMRVDTIHPKVLFDFLCRFGSLIFLDNRYAGLKTVLVLGSTSGLYICILATFDAQADILEMGRFLNLISGIILTSVKHGYILYNRDRVHGIILRRESRAVELRKRAQDDVELRHICDKFYWKQRLLFLSVTMAELSLLTLVFLESMINGDLIVGNFELGTPAFCLLSILVFLAVVFTDTNYLLLDLLIGGLIQETLKDLSVVLYDLRQLLKGRITCDEKQERLIGIAKKYQEIVTDHNVVTSMMSGYFCFYLGCVLLVMIFVCVELSILVNEDVWQCMEPLYYFFYINMSFFYWCWLGESFLTMSQDIAEASMVYDPEVDDKRLVKTMVMFHQMVSMPLRIGVKAVFSFNYELFVAFLQTYYKFTTLLKDVNAAHE